MKEKSIFKRTIALAVPMMIQNGITNAVGLVDSLMVGSLGSESITAVTIACQLIFVFNLAIFGGISGPGIYGAQYYGQGNIENVRNVYRLKIWICVVCAIAGILVFINGGSTLVGLYLKGTTETVDKELALRYGVQYLNIMVCQIIPFIIIQIYASTLRETGESIKPMVAGIVSVVLDVVFNYILIFGKFGFPALGIAGAAIATVLGTVAALVLSLYFLTRPDAFINLNYCRNNLELSDKKEVKGYVSMWGHVMIENVFTRLGFLISSALTARIGSFAMSIYAVGMHLMDLNYAIASGFQVTAISKTGHLNGAGERDKINTYAVRLLFFGLIFALALSALIIAFAEPYYSIFSSDEQFIQSGVKVCMIIAVISPIQIVKIIHTGLLQGLGKMRETKIAAILSVTIAQPICLFILVNIAHMGLMGVWCSTLFSQLIWLITTRIFYVKVKRNGFK